MRANSIAIIPARGGSKRIPRKNIRLFQGKPVICYAIETAIQSGLFETVMVSTEDEEIAAIAKQAGAQVPFLRSEKTSNDYATTVDVLLEVLDQYAQQGKTFVYGCCIYPVTPLITHDHINHGWNKLFQSNFDSILPVVAWSFPIWRSVRIIDDKIEWIWPEHASARSQDLVQTFHDTGQWYWFRINALQREKVLMTNNSSYVIIDELVSQDVDNETDWRLMELKYRMMHGKA